MANTTDHVRVSDVSFWGVVALAAWGVAILGGGISAFLPDGVLAGLHASRIEGANLGQLRAQIAQVQAQSADLKQQNAVLLQRFDLNEETAAKVARRVGALELSVPKLIEAANSTPRVDSAAVTASIGAPPTTGAIGGSVATTTTPLYAETPAASAQPMPPALPTGTGFGIAIGPPFDIGGGTAEWQEAQRQVGALLLGLSPILTNVEGGPGRRLVAGPLATEADARELCGRIAKSGIACASVPFIGQPLPASN